MTATQDLLRTPLYDLHVARGGKMVPFAGYEMPVQYKPGVLKEHLHTREKAGLFDVSHMGQVILRPKSGETSDAAHALESLVPVDVQNLGLNRQRYAFFTNEQGGILDDLMIANRGDHLFLVVNAACKTADIAHLTTNLSQTCTVEPVTDRALLALQGPRAEAALSTLVPDCAGMRFMDIAELSINGVSCVVSRSGYSGEDGYEISLPQDQSVSIAEALLAYADVEPIGLGARDSLRLEAGLCLYGSDLDETTTPVEAALAWAIQKSRRQGGTAQGGFPGEVVIMDQLANGTERRRVGLTPEGRAPVRAGSALYADDTTDSTIGTVTSGGFGPTVGHPVSMAYVTTTHATIGTQLFADVRGKRLPVVVSDLPFITPNYKRT